LADNASEEEPENTEVAEEAMLESSMVLLGGREAEWSHGRGGEPIGSGSDQKKKRSIPVDRHILICHTVNRYI
jgi:hypothetical protein